MKKITMIMLSCFTMSSIGLYAQEALKIEGKISGLKDNQKIYLSGSDSRDSATIKNGTFSLIVPKPLIGGYSLEIGNQTVKEMLLGPGTVIVSGEASNMTNLNFNVDNNATARDWKTYNDLLQTASPNEKDLQAKMLEINKRYEEAAQKNNSAEIEKIQSEGMAFWTNYQAERLRLLQDWFSKHQRSDINAHVLSFLADDREVNVEYIQKWFNGLSSEQKTSRPGQRVSDRLSVLSKLAIGKAAPEFSLPDNNGKVVSLKALRGKYVLIDFWASWCGPCRAENPNVLKAYNKYKDQGKGFTVLGISLDDKKAEWLKAVKEDGMPWVHVSDLKAHESPTVKLYNISGIPDNYLIDPNGIIVANNLRGEALDKKLAELTQK